MGPFQVQRTTEGIPLALVWALNLLGVVVGLVASVWPHPIAWLAAAAAPLAAMLLNRRWPDRFLLGDQWSPRARSLNDASPGPLGTIVLLWGAPGLILLMGALPRTRHEAVTPTIVATLLVAAALTAAVLSGERRLRNIFTGSFVAEACLFCGMGYVLSARLAFARLFE